MNRQYHRVENAEVKMHCMQQAALHLEEAGKFSQADRIWQEIARIRAEEKRQRSDYLMQLLSFSSLLMSIL